MTPSDLTLAQEPSSEQQSALVDGLLDLLSDPEPMRAPDPPTISDQASMEATAGGGEGQADDPSLADNPLAVVGKDMRTAATQLSRGIVDSQTRQLQDEIVQRLNSLIEEMQQTDPSQRSASRAQRQRSSEREASESPSSAQPQTPKSDSKEASDEEGDDRAGAGNQAAQDRPSQAGPAADVIVDLADPERLQQDVWGQLPAQVRKQMQSRMVERFLPSYRPQIEAYFRALLQSEQR